MRFTTVVSLALLTAGAVAQNNVFGGNQNNNNNNNNNNDNQNNNNNNNQDNNNNNNDQNNNNNDQNNNNNNNNNQAGDAALQLDPANVQAGSNADGQAEGAEEGQAASLTDPANFINFCTGKTLTNGVQEEGGSCNGIPMGDIPSTGNMVSSIIINPQPGQDLPFNAANPQDIEFQVQVQGLVAGSFTNPDNTYYSAPQQLQGGQIVGHTHVTVQDLGPDLIPDNPPDPQTFAFFKGINDPGNGNGLLTAVAPGGLPPGNYRVCTMTSASNHQPVLMPVAQRGAQDDCTKFTVGNPNGQNNNNNNNNNNQDNANQDQQNQDNANQDQQNQDNANQDQQNQDAANQDQQNQDAANQDQQNQDAANQDQQNQDQQNQNNANQDQQNQNQNNQNQNQNNNQFGNGGFGNGGFGGFGNRFGRNRFGRNRRFAAREFIA